MYKVSVYAHENHNKSTFPKALTFHFSSTIKINICTALQPRTNNAVTESDTYPLNYPHI